MRFSKTILLILTGIAIGACSLLPDDKTEPDPPSQAGLYPSPYTEPSVSPDGAHIFFLREKVTHVYRGAIAHSADPDSTGIWMMDADGRNPRMLLRGRWYHNPSLSPDGNWLLFGQGGSIFKVPFDGEQVDTAGIVQLTHEGRNFYPDWSPDGQWIAYDNTSCGTSIEDPPENSCGILTMNKDGNDKKLLFQGRMPAWHPDGERVIGIIGTSSTSVWKRFKIYTIHNGYSEILDAIEDANNLYPKYSPDGDHIAFQSNTQAWIMDADGNNLNRLTTEGGHTPAWTPDGRIVYIHYDIGEFARDNGTIWIMNADGSGKNQLSYNHGLELQ